MVLSGRIPMVYLECVSCKARSIYKVSQNSYVYLAGTCTNCHHFHRGRWTAVTLRNETLVLDSSSTTTGRDGMNLVLRQGILRDGDSYVFTLHVTDGNMDREGVASITLQPNMPPGGGDCDLRAGGGGEGGPIRTLVDRVHFNCSGRHTLYSTLLCYILLYYILLYYILLYSTIFNSILLYATLLYSTIIYSILLYSILLYSTLFYYTLLCSTVLYSILLYSTLFSYTLLYSTIIYSI
uniref:REJ domain-containing protein n=1 Tax=Hucho hucho TaxID=62062 RepID=A0A4W5K583_9TELE